MTMIIQDQEKKELLSIARTTIEAAFEERQVKPQQAFPIFSSICSCFVTLHTNSGQLRGCIGHLTATESLEENVIHNAVNAAFRDTRFPQLTANELDSIYIEISVLTPATPVNDTNDITLGQHGIILQKNNRSAVFLPQVAPEQGWDLPTTLTHLAVKAGLRPDDWQADDATFNVFEAIVFSEKDFT